MRQRLRVMLLRRLLPPLDENIALSLAETFDSGRLSIPEEFPTFAMRDGVYCVYNAIRDGRLP
jgi:hypothetical protein